eukprot:8633729-Alexandrium_andersonii.AAC.2
MHAKPQSRLPHEQVRGTRHGCHWQVPRAHNIAVSKGAGLGARVVADTLKCLAPIGLDCTMPGGINTATKSGHAPRRFHKTNVCEARMAMREAEMLE